MYIGIIIDNVSPTIYIQYSHPIIFVITDHVSVIDNRCYDDKHKSHIPVYDLGDDIQKRDTTEYVKAVFCNIVFVKGYYHLIL